MGDVVKIKPLHLEENSEFVADCCRYRENILDEKAVKKKWKFDAATWERLGEDDALVEKIEAESVRRIRNGSHKREKAQLLVVKAPDVAASIMNSTEANDRHRLDACKVLNDLSANPADNTPAAMDRFVIQINLGADTNGNPIIEKYDKSIAIDANDGAPNDGSAARSMPAANKWDDGDHVVAVPVVKTIAHETGKKPVKTATKTPIEHEAVRARSPQEIALESMMRY